MVFLMQVDMYLEPCISWDASAWNVTQFCIYILWKASLAEFLLSTFQQRWGWGIPLGILVEHENNQSQGSTKSKAKRRSLIRNYRETSELPRQQSGTSIKMDSLGVFGSRSYWGSYSHFPWGKFSPEDPTLISPDPTADPTLISPSVVLMQHLKILPPCLDSIAVFSTAVFHFCTPSSRELLFRKWAPPPALRAFVQPPSPLPGLCPSFFTCKLALITQTSRCLFSDATLVTFPSAACSSPHSKFFCFRLWDHLAGKPWNDLTCSHLKMVASVPPCRDSE